MWTGFVVAISLVALLGSGCGSDSTARREVSRVSQLFEVASRGGSARQLTDDRFDHSAPEWSPSRRLLADIAGTSSKSVVEVLRTDGSLVRRLPAGSGPVDEAPAWSPDGRELAFIFLRDAEEGVIGTLLVANLRGRTRRLAEPVTGRPGWSPDGRWLAFRRGAAVPTVVGGKEVPTDGVGEDLALVAAGGGRVRRLAASTGDGQFHPQWSPDGRRVLFSRQDSSDTWSIRTVVVDGGGELRLAGGLVDILPDWSPDGRQIAVVATRIHGKPVGGVPVPRLYLLPRGGGRLKRLVDEATGAPAWSPDGKLIAFPDGDRIKVVSPNGSRMRTVTHLRGEQISDLAWSPDGSRIAFVAGRPPPED